ncbi:hypothetical protein PNK_1878 [Candidatus Protochlamydia naegleriophila]|uniref:Uncharacterized protein n=1 Tax=Candidatus Protochlamydia naegleriophila TaxID=389348 RepID=A0A0U5CR94_9BACT|nr:hypothetical protein [Candidatus Protochlamydia naegleriophila]CUI17484.1 hypothetical protein PNK_1878 [Candidatus Protochlamydia naegleriophila]
MAHSFSGPSVFGLFIQPFMGFGVGYTIGRCTKAASPGVFGLALAVHQLAEIAIYGIANGLLGDGGRRSAKIYAMTNITFSLTTMGLLYRWGLIGQIGVIVSAVLIGIESYTKCKDFSYYRTAQLAQ